MTLLYINEEHCTSTDQLKGYLRNHLDYFGPIFKDIACLTPSEISEFLREQNEDALATAVEKIDTNVGDAEYVTMLTSAIVGAADNDSSFIYNKPDIKKCIECVSIDIDNRGQDSKVNVVLRVILSVNETYELKIQTNWGTQGQTINLAKYNEGECLQIDFVFRKRTGMGFEIINVWGDDTELDEIPKGKESFVSKSDNVDMPVLPLVLIDKDVIKYWIQKFSNQKYLFYHTDAKCVNMDALDKYLISVYDLNCHLQHFKGTIEELIEQIYHSVPLGIKNKMVKNNQTILPKERLGGIIDSMMDDCKRSKGISIGKKNPLSYIDIDAFLCLLKDNFGIEIDGIEFQNQVHSQNQLYSFISEKCGY